MRMRRATKRAEERSAVAAAERRPARLQPAAGGHEAAIASGIASGKGASGVPLIGQTIRALRKRKEMSLQDLAAASGVSLGMLSQIERDRANPSLRVLTRIREALDAPVSALFEEVPAGTADPDFVRRAGHHPRLDLGYISKELLSSKASRNLQFMILHVPPGAATGDHPIAYAAEKGGLVLDGELALSVGSRETLVRAGDSFFFDGTLPHGFRNPGKIEARVLWIIVTVGVERHL